MKKGTNKKGTNKKGTNKKGTMETEKKIYYSDLANYIEVCYSCKGQDIVHYDDERESFCNDCFSEDIGSVAQDEVL
jgi:hypothetical protein